MNFFSVLLLPLILPIMAIEGIYRHLFFLPFMRKKFHQKFWTIWEALNSQEQFEWVIAVKENELQELDGSLSWANVKPELEVNSDGPSLRAKESEELFQKTYKLISEGINDEDKLEEFSNYFQKRINFSLPGVDTYDFALADQVMSKIFNNRKALYEDFLKRAQEKDGTQKNPSLVNA